MKLKDYIQIFALTIIVALVLKFFVVDAVVVSSSSMERTLMNGDLVLVNKLVFASAKEKSGEYAGFVPMNFPLKRISRGDVIVFRYPGDRDQTQPTSTIDYVKRCVGLAGDTVMIRSGMIFVNGRYLHLTNEEDRPNFSHDYADVRLFPKGVPNNLDFYGPVIVPAKDNVMALNARTFSMFEKVIRNEGHNCLLAADGTVFVDGQPQSSYKIQKNYLFVLGDNFYESSDSRFWGFVPESSVTGEALVIYWSRTPSTSTDSRIASAIRWDRIGTFVQ